MENCVFCKVKNGDFNTQFVYEDEDVMVFPDIHPQKPVHLLVVPKNHIEEVQAVEDSIIFSKLFSAVRKAAKDQGLEGKGYKVIINAGGAQEVNHLHIHVMGPVGVSAKI